MLRAFTFKDDHLVELKQLPDAAATDRALWIDLLSPTPEEDEQVEQLLAITIPSRAEMEEIELSDRLYSQEGAEFMTLTALAKLDTEEPTKTPLTFILKGPNVVTVRYEELKPFQAYIGRAQRSKGAPCATGELVMLAIIEALIDRLADALEKVGNEVDGLSRNTFQQRTSRADGQQRNLEAVIQAIGRKSELLTMIQESLVGIARVSSYHRALDGTTAEANEGRQLVKLIQRDSTWLGGHASALSGRVTFLLDATLGLINLQQNQIIKIVSVAAVVFLPPTLVASVYGMNFQFMPELAWYVGYPFALGLMLLSAVLPYLFFKNRGWL